MKPTTIKQQLRNLGISIMLMFFVFQARAYLIEVDFGPNQDYTGLYLAYPLVYYTVGILLIGGAIVIGAPALFYLFWKLLNRGNN